MDYTEIVQKLKDFFNTSQTRDTGFRFVNIG